tara:strand:+ start:1419 stop:2852 length:1434 start_codon:yes stop_codon:yes gene_type:complete
MLEMKRLKFFILGVIFFYTGSINGQETILTLEECVLLAIEKNISIKQSELELETAEIDKSDAIGNFFPSLNIQTNHSWNVGLNQNITTGLLENLTTQYTSMGANLGVSIYRGLTNIKQLHRANLSLLAKQYQLDNMKDDIILFVANSYLQVMFNREILEVQKIQLDITKKDLERTKNLVDAGVRIKSDLLEIEANLASQEQSLILAENNLRITKINLAQVLLITDYENFDVAKEDFEVPFSEILIENPKDIFEKALSFRNDIKLAMTNVEIAENDIKLAKSSLQPSLAAFYGYSSRISYSDRLKGTGNYNFVPIGFVSTTGDQVLTSIEERETAGPLPVFDQIDLNEGHNFGVQLSIPVFNGNSARNNVERSRVNLERFKNQFEQTKLDLENTINQAYNDTKGAYKLYEASQRTVEAREKAYNDSFGRFEAGVLNSFDFVQIKQRYETAVSDLVRAKFDYIFKLKVLEFYFGIPIEI